MEDKNKDKDDEFGFLVHCDVCARDLTHMLHLSCAVCAGLSAGIINGSNTNGSNINGVLGGDGSGGGGSSMGTETETGAAIAIDAEPFDLCVSCFASGAQPKTHRRTHDYLVKEGLDWPLFDAKWTAHEELLLVDGLKLYGIGNWDQISTHIGTKSKEELDAHYRSVYCASESWPIPNMSIEFDKFSTRKYICRDPNPPLRKPERSCTSGPANHEIQGYMPGRDEFDHEFEHEAENPVKDMAFEDHDTPEEISLKTTMLNIYNMYLDRRIERKKFLKDRNIMFDFKKQQNIEKKRSKDERDLLGRIRVFAKLQTAADFEDFSEGMLRS
ncbi:Transcriptional adapter ada2 [Physocladia obscura]|uniref:Transcriptional adapter ada2 n=1 Tax=Physocladia obscura TaxID=109957 RepID=A0AAD5T4D2_9FUNG|nr:Transcriptional adapter ada2 [Physocladia obscura]